MSTSITAQLLSMEGCSESSIPVVFTCVKCRLVIKTHLIHHLSCPFFQGLPKKGKEVCMPAVGVAIIVAVGVVGVVIGVVAIITANANAAAQGQQGC
jgi:hypothetical protein